MKKEKRIRLIVAAVMMINIVILASVLTHHLFFDEDEIYTLGLSDKVLKDEGATDDGVEDIIWAHNQFAMDLYLELINGTDDNIFISPFSIYTALSMVYEGARGNTALEMADVLNLPEDDSIRRASFAKVQNDLNNRRGEVKLNCANSLWTQKDHEYQQEFIDIVEDYYFSEVFSSDFTKNPEGSRKDINEWVSEETEEKIPEILPPDSLTALTRSVLVNALYFKGEWATGFDKEKTKEGTFYLDEYRSVKVPMMHTEDDPEDTAFSYAHDDLVTILELPYKGEKISMLIFLPEWYYIGGKPQSIENLESILSADYYEEQRSRLHQRDVEVSMPKFEFKDEYKLNSTLKNMGMETAFTIPEADFSGIKSDENLYIKEVYHDTYIKVDESGTEAAAATAVDTQTWGGSFSINIDRPFIFMIQDMETGLILFMGRIMDPSVM